jgi:hypothetical protein
MYNLQSQYDFNSHHQSHRGGSIDQDVVPLQEPTNHGDMTKNQNFKFLSQIRFLLEELQRG